MTDMGELLDRHFETVEAVHEAFGYSEDWCIFPLSDYREFWWRLDETPGAGDYDKGVVEFWKHEENIGSWEDDDGYQESVLPNRFLPQSVWRTEHFTMVLVDTGTDGNRLLAVFDNAKVFGAVLAGQRT